ncbi:MarR family transcriptional regulator [Rhodobacteraceae bacterium RKSG542]|uniref:MarR family winged helix-turn-helix transcriptional regulator n=1 Tax=Pseudovibrio flavus TaxID=2529854 RepID=UPI0012BBF22D|nr:MarR family transcriptional regulator [Pseudovibrio flavus]MTI16450.1 MarR family transcriptional regulator [Pseudovibrio flavus]
MSHQIKDPSLATQRVRLWLQMLKAVRSVESNLRERLRNEHDMTLPRFDVMATLCAHPDGLRMTELSEQLVVSNGNVTGIIEKLVEEGLVERQSIQNDRRAHLVKTTEKGRKLMDHVTAEHRGWVDELFEGVSEPDVARAISIMLDIRHHTSR